MNSKSKFFYNIDILLVVILFLYLCFKYKIIWIVFISLIYVGFRILLFQCVDHTDSKFGFLYYVDFVIITLILTYQCSTSELPWIIVMPPIYIYFRSALYRSIKKIKG